ncbi:MAG: hypothetical protein IPM48_06500 [Saprospiraceae bacterium]|nr:hypothetical protein [Saprospiraceae bacterium]
MNRLIFTVFLFSFSIDKPLGALPEFHNHWYLIGSSKLDYSSSVCEISIRQDKGVFTELRIDGKAHSVFIDKCTVLFLDSSYVEYPIQELLLPGKNRKTIDLKSNFKMIQKIILHWRPKDQLVKNTWIELYGKN